MKVAVISYWACPMKRLGTDTGGGMSVYILNFANYLARMGHQVDIFTRSHREKDVSIINPHKNVRIIHFKQTDFEDLYQDAVNFAGTMKGFIRKNRITYDIIHSHYYYSGISGMIIRNSLKIPWLHTYHTLGAVKNRRLGLRDRGRIDTEDMIARNADGLIVSTDLEREDLLKSHKPEKRKIHVIYPGVDHRIFHRLDRKKTRNKLGIPEDKKIILFVGRIDPAKGLTTLITATGILFRRIGQDIQSLVQLLFIGGDPHAWRDNAEFVKIRNQIRRNSLSRSVEFLGSKPYHKLPLYYNAADVVVLPSLYESFGFVLLEAMACGTAVIASDVGGPRFLIRDGHDGCLFKSENAADLAEQTERILTEDPFRTKLGRNAEISSKRFCWDKQAGKLAAVYKKFI